MHSFFISTVPIWNSIPEHIISLAAFKASLLLYNPLCPCFFMFIVSPFFVLILFYVSWFALMLSIKLFTEKTLSRTLLASYLVFLATFCAL